MTIAHHYDPETLLYTHSLELVVSAGYKEPLIPQCCCLNDLPDYDVNTQCLKFNNGSWDVIKKKVKVTAYNKETKVPKEFEDETEVTDDYTTLEPPSYWHEFVDGEWVIDEFKAAKRNLADKRWLVANGGIVIDGVNIQSDKPSKDEMAGYVTESIVNGLISVNWKLLDGTFKVYTVQEFKKVYQIVAKYRNDCFGAEMDKITEIDAAADPKLVDIESGWPENTFVTS